MSLGVVVTMAGFKQIDFDSAKIRKALRLAGREVQKEARSLVSRRAVSKPGAYPGRDSGALRRSIRYRILKSGFEVRVATDKTPEMDVFYPAILMRGRKKRLLLARKNFIEDALESRRDAAHAAILAALKDSLKPR